MLFRPNKMQIVCKQRAMVVNNYFKSFYPLASMLVTLQQDILLKGPEESHTHQFDARRGKAKLNINSVSLLGRKYKVRYFLTIGNCKEWKRPKFPKIDKRSSCLPNLKAET